MSKKAVIVNSKDREDLQQQRSAAAVASMAEDDHEFFITNSDTGEVMGLDQAVEKFTVMTLDNGANGAKDNSRDSSASGRYEQPGR